MLIDAYQRRIDYIRLSITDRCDFRCTYCMAEDMTFLPRDEVMSLEECLRLVNIFAQLGVSKVRITGGEPLVRKNALWLFQQIGQIPQIKSLVTTTNGSQLSKYASALKQAGVSRINISLDSLREDVFKKITRIGDLNKVLQGIQAAQACGFDNIKLNSVLMRGINDNEIDDLVDFAIERQLDISFIEEMPLGEVDHLRGDTFISNQQVLQHLQQRFTLTPLALTTGGPAQYWQIEGKASKLGLISPHSHNFCERCNRVRISCRGELFLCLGHEDKVDLLPLLRDYPHQDEPIRQAILHSMAIKPQGHDFDLQRQQPAVVRFMSHTGG